MKNVVGYIRVSTDGQLGEDKFGLEAQKEQIEKYCAEHDMEIAKWYSDLGESGAKYRPGFDSIIYGEATNPPFEAVVVAKSDRVARDVNVYFYYQAQLLRKNIELISISEDFGQFGSYANIIKAFVITCAEMERNNIMKRTSGGRKIKAERGGHAGGKAPYGYDVSPRAGLVINPDEADVVRLIFEARDNGALTSQIKELLINRKIKNRSGKDFSFSSIKYIIDNRRTYEGWYKYGSMKEAVRGDYEPILNEKK